MKYPYDKIRNLRKQGYTYTEINERLDTQVPKSSLAYICKNIDLPSHYAEKLKQLNRRSLASARELSVEASKKRWETQQEDARVNASLELGDPDRRTALTALSLLYLGEGSKRSGFRGLALGSSDPMIVELYIELLRVVFNIPREKLKARVLYRADQDIAELTEYWSGVTGIKTKDFYKTTPDARTIGKPTKKTSYKGVCAIHCAGSDKQLALQAYSEVLLEKIRGYSSVD